MLIYNNRKEFVNVTDDTLKKLGYFNARQLHEDAVDFADLFENKPGFVHNFKNFSWIDFLLHSEQDNVKARIRCNGKVYECGFKIDNYPMDDADGFTIELTELITIGDDKNSHPRSQFDEPVKASSPEPTPSSTPARPTTVSSETEISQEPISIPDFQDEPISMPDFQDEAISMNALAIEEETDDNNSSLDFGINIDSEPESLIESPQETQPATEMEPTFAPTVGSSIDSAFIESLQLETSPDYAYDPSIAADELGLPSDLIDEFVGDFVIQAKKFRPDLEDAIEKHDYDNVQILSHKLKGVAANLRIEDALEVLTFINTSKDDAKLKDYLNYLYHIVNRLEFGEDAPSIESTIDTRPAVEADNFELNMSQIETEDGAMDLSSMENLDIIPMDLEPMPTEDAITLTTEDHSDSEEELYSFDLMDSDNENSKSLDMDFDEPLIATDDQPILSPENDFPNLSDEDLSFPAVEESEDFRSLDHIDTDKFDIHATAENLDIPMETLKSYIDDFVDQANTLKGNLESALVSQDLEQVKELATQLKGISEALNMNYASELLSTLQTTKDPKEAIKSAKKLFVFIREL